MYETLSDYLSGEGVSVKELACKVGVKPAAIYRYKDGIRKPRPEIAFKLVAACNNKINFDSFYK